MEHSELVRALKKKPEAVQDSLSAHKCDLIHMVMGISGEAGELLDAIKRHVMYESPINMDNVIEELGDIEFYLEGFRQSLGIKREATLEHNIQKLSKRYNKLSFTNEDAVIRADKH